MEKALTSTEVTPVEEAFEALESMLKVFDNETIKKTGLVSFSFTRKEDMNLEVVVEYENHTKRATITQDDLDDETIDQRFIDYVAKPSSDWKKE